MLRKISPFTSLIVTLFFTVATYAQSKDELKLKSLYDQKNFEKCDQLSAKLEKKSTGDELAMVHIYGALCNMGYLLDEQYDVYDNKKPIKIVAQAFSDYVKLASDSLRLSFKSEELKVLTGVETVVVNQLELGKYRDAYYLAEKLLKGDSLNIGAALVLEFTNLADLAKSEESHYQYLIEKKYPIQEIHHKFHKEVAILYAAWLKKQGKSDLAKNVAQDAINVTGEDELLQVFIE